MTATRVFTALAVGAFALTIVVLTASWRTSTRSDRSGLAYMALNFGSFILLFAALASHGPESLVLIVGSAICWGPSSPKIREVVGSAYARVDRRGHIKD